MGEKISAVLVAVILLSCFACASCTQGIILNKTLLQELPGMEQTILDTLNPEKVVDVTCRVRDALVFDDPWWLLVTYAPPNRSTTTGWVADFDVNCGNVGNCDVPLCSR